MKRELLEENIDIFIHALAAYEGKNTFNPWRDYDFRYDKSIDAPRIRRENLKNYLLGRIGHCPLMVVAEAIGYQGGRFTGIAITCERMLLNEHKEIGVDHILPKEAIPSDLSLLRTSHRESEFIVKPTQREKGFNEPTDTVVWGAILENRLDPFTVLLWNIYPFHPHKAGNPLTNRTPTPEELQVGWEFTKALLTLNGEATIMAVGQKAATTIEEFGHKAHALRHPANGGATKFREGFKEVILSL